MSGRVQQSSMFFLGLPDLQKLVCVSLTLPEGRDEEPRSKQIKTCRELVLLYSDILASPALDSFTEITAVMALQFLHRGILQVFARRRSLQLGSPQCVFPGVLQCCLSYSLITRLAPRWNKAGLYLVTGKDFLTERGRLNAVSMELSTSEGRLSFSIEANTVRLPPPTLEDFGFPPLVLRRFCSDPDAVLDPSSSTGGAVWCHVLPSMKKGQIITISRQLPRDGPFRTYRDLQNHWNCLYGYRLPELTEGEVVYCSVYFRPVGERLFTYPLSCVRLQPVQRCPRADLQGALSCFLSDVRERLQSVCGFSARLSGKACYHTVGLSSAATVQVLTAEQINLTSSSSSSSSSSIRPVLTQLPPPPLQSVKPSLSSQPLSQQDGAQGLLGNGGGFKSCLKQSRACTGGEDGPSSSSSSSFSSSSSSSSSSHVSFSVPDSSGYSSAPSLPPRPPPSQTPVIPAPKLVPIFRSMSPWRRVNVALLRVQKEQLRGAGGGGEERRRVTLPAFRNTTPSSAPSSSFVSSFSATSLPVPPPPTIPSFRPPPPPPPPPSAPPKVKRLHSLSPASRSRPGLLRAPKLEIKFKSRSSPKTSVKFSAGNESTANSSSKEQEEPGPPPTPPPPPDTSTSSREGVVFKSKPKRSRPAVGDVDVEQMARSNQLSRLSSSSLLSWLRGRGAVVGAKHRKEELMLKVMSCLAEA